LGSTWLKHVEEFSPITHWPACLHHPKAAADDEWLDLADFSSLPKDMLELDDQHAAFLEGSQYKEVEHLVSLMEVTLDPRSVNCCIMEHGTIECQLTYTFPVKRRDLFMVI
jgi:hypothetical protein